MTDIETALKEYAARTEAMALEALKEIYHRIPFGEEIHLANGQVAVIEKFVRPKIDEQGEIRAGIDVTAKDGSWHLEFTLKKTGWGAALGALGGSPIDPPKEIVE